MNCGYCCYKTDKYPGEMTLETTLKTIEKFAKEENSIEFLGGEPLLKTELIKNIIDTCKDRFKDKSFTYSLITNGLLLNDDFVKYAIRNDLSISLSLDGIKEAHDKFRKLKDGNDSWDIIIEKLKMLLKNSPYSPVLMTLNPETVKYLSASYKFLIDNKVNTVNLSLNHQAEWKPDDFVLLEQELNFIADCYINAHENNEIIVFNPFDSKIHAYITSNISKGRCSINSDHVTVAPDGSIFPCIAFIDKNMKYQIGNINDGINTNKLNDFKEMCNAVINNLDCVDCEFADRCFNWCSCANYLGTKTLSQIPFSLCEYEKILIPIADRVGNTLYESNNEIFMKKFYNISPKNKNE